MDFGEEVQDGNYHLWKQEATVAGLTCFISAAFQLTQELEYTSCPPPSYHIPVSAHLTKKGIKWEIVIGVILIGIRFPQACKLPDQDKWLWSANGIGRVLKN